MGSINRRIAVQAALGTKITRASGRMAKAVRTPV
jgi:hypothetical protein